MVSVSQTPWAPYTGTYTTPWGSGTEDRVGHRTVWNSIFGELVWALNGGLSVYNFNTVMSHFSTPGRTWAALAISESKVDWDPQDGHCHAGTQRSSFGNSKIMKKNLDPRSARVVWTALDGSPMEKYGSGMVVIGGVYSMVMTPSYVAGGYTPGSVSSTSYTNFYPPFISYGGARYANSLAPFAPWVQPIVVANFLIPCLTDATGNIYPPALASYGRWGIEQVQVGLEKGGSWTFDDASPGFWVWWSGFSFQASQTSSTLNVNVVVPWIAFGPGRDKGL